VATLIEPAVWIDATLKGCAATIIERPQVVEALAAMEPEEGPGVASPAPKDRPITVVVVNHSSEPPVAETFNVADPRKAPESWPWTGPVG
jgi:hypothetical protein